MEIVTVIGVVRLWVIISHFFFPAPYDATHNIGFCLSSIENNLAIITASAPALKPLFRHWFPNLFTILSDKACDNHNGGTYAVPGTRYGRGTRKSGTGLRGSRFMSGNAAFILEDLPDVRDGRIENLNKIRRVNGQGEGDSEQEIVRCEGIMKTTNISVKYGDGDGKSEISGSRNGMRTSAESLLE
ncbi:hypothetical protein NHQ30_009987 [Ciborinia camelliae]|nr:hypothetical protein NHQ30_009987 [Ciborinia camelliae]